ncbi:molybdopterin-guanine dinucleotide biosynthesis protein A [Pedobacter terrae]|uniref:Molybdopterin-guanine dinucleotide biosynthesis protein A n=1 Tax=Pedobacter terrae TaxID=405671 RepID=A0A1G7N3Q2_9SPHI|nr:molybdenum cofactor guanylyltransferase [Pedobacter terrae]SDF68634.1 molybdopterin-guanine dinucleotide biosynthesis protein A [Pedobacter terrae]
MLGIVLCGGQSLRMGTDKGLLNHDDKLWAQAAADKLESLDLPVKFSVNPLQQLTYSGYFGNQQLIVDNTSLDLRGPLLGALSAHLSNNEEDLFLLACDILLMETRLLEKLIHSAKADGTFDAYIFTKDGQQEPLCGIYKSEGLKKIIFMLQNNALTKHSMKYVLGNLRVSEIAVEDHDYHYFGNFNSQEEIKRVS